MHKTLPTVLTIAGSDSGGGAGIQADLRTFHAFGVYGCSVITAVTAQNPNEVRRVDILPEAAVRTQLECVLDAFPVRYAKTGMLANKEIAGVVAGIVEKCKLPLVVDPVMVSTSGAQLLENAAIKVMEEKLFPLAQWLTPNIPEAELICGKTIKTSADLADAALMLYHRYGCNVILKSGHALSSGSVSDHVCYQGGLFTISSPVVHVDGNTAHGTGCTLSAALAAGFASGKPWQEVLTEAKAFVYGSLAENMRLGKKLAQMYPPENSYCSRVTWAKVSDH